MRSKLRINNSVSFVQKLLNILEDPQCHPYVQWTETENGFNISNVSGFSQNVLPTYFKHQNYSSFVRQLNMYGFTKVRSKDGDNIYEHKNFKRGSKTCVKKIQRKITSQSSPRENQIVLYRPGSLFETRKTQGELQKLRQKQLDLQKKCLTLLQRNKELLEQNQMIISTIKSQQAKKKKLLDQIIAILSHKPNQLQIQAQPELQPIKTQQAQENLGTNFEQLKTKQPINILDPHEQYLKLDDFINIDYDELSEVFKL